jgi:hypothetical protein
MRRTTKKSLRLFSNTKSEAGFSLIELLLGIAITMLLADIFIHVCLNLVKQHTRLNDKITLSENAKFAEFILRKEIQTAGFCGCNHLDRLNIHYHLSRFYLPMVAIQLFSPASFLMGKAVHPESDILLIEKMSEKTNGFLGYLTMQSIKVNKKTDFQAGDPLMIADCIQADIFVPQAISEQPSFQVMMLNKPLIGHYHRHAEIGKLIAKAFFVQRTGRKNRYGQPIKALYSYDVIHHCKTEWITGVEAMKVFYAMVNGDDSSVVFQPFSSEKIDLSALRLIKIVLSMSTEGNWPTGAVERKTQEILISLRELI